MEGRESSPESHIALRLATRTPAAAEPNQVEAPTPAEGRPGAEGRSATQPASRLSLDIGQKLGLVIAGALLAIAAFLTFWFQARQSRAMLEEQRRKADTYAQLVSQQVRSAIAFDDRETAREVFEAVANDHDLVAATLYRENGRALHSWGQLSDVGEKARSGVDQRHVFNLGDRILAVAPVISPEGPRGTLALELGTDGLREARSAARRDAAATGAVALILGFGLALLIAHSFARRLRAIATVAERVAGGDLEQTPADDAGRDEIGSLARSFAAMLQQFKDLFEESRRRAEQQQARLETLVQQRTHELAVRNDDMRRVLENVGQGFLTIDRSARISREHSAILDTWLGPKPNDECLWTWIDRAAPGISETLELAWEQVVEGSLPLDLCLDQMPKRFRSDQRTYQLSYKPILESSSEFERLLVIVSDITLELESAQSEAEAQELARIVSRLLEDRTGVVEFFSDANDLIEALTKRPPLAPLAARRLLHTLEGNCLVFGLQSMGDRCHQIEETLLETGEELSLTECEKLNQCWRRVSGRLTRMIEGQDEHHLTIEEEDYHEILGAIEQGREHAAIARLVAAWRLEPVKARLNRAARQVERMARELGKEPVRVVVEHNRIRLDPRRWRPFWSALTHLLRNAVDHGLELPEERLALGKPEEATITLKAALVGERLRIEVRDSGRGIDWAALTEEARRKGLPLDSGRESVVEALFSDGVSTCEEATDMSGRGVGMGGVRQAVHELGGAIEVQSSPGSGTCFRMSWPPSALEPDQPHQLSISTISKGART